MREPERQATRRPIRPQYGKLVRRRSPGVEASCVRLRSCRPLLVLVPFVLALGLGVGRAEAAPTCADHPDQASAQRAADTRDADGDGVYCESNPCPCAKPAPRRSARRRPRCERPRGVRPISFSATRYSDIRRHFLDAVAAGAPRVLTVNRPGAAGRRERLLSRYPTRPGMDRDEYPPAVGRRTWRASVAYVPSPQNRSHGATLGIKLRRFCDGTRVKYVFY